MRYIEICLRNGHRYRFYQKGVWRSKADWLPWEKVSLNCVTG